MDIDQIKITDGSCYTSCPIEPYEGGGIYNSGTLILHNSEIRGNLGVAGGGGIYNVGTMIVTNSDLLGNSGRFGGAIYNTGTMTVNRGVLSQNRGNAGGAIYNTGTMTVNTTALSDNSVVGDGTVGGAIYNSGNFTLNISAVTGNAASGMHGIAGGIYNDGSDQKALLTVITSSLTDNTAFDSGGGIFNLGIGSVTILDSTFSKNSAFLGGGLANGYNDDQFIQTHNRLSRAVPKGVHRSGDLRLGTITISDSRFSENKASKGGAIYSIGTTLTVSQSTLSGNIATSEGGGVFSNISTTSIENSTFSGNSAEEGGGLFADQSTLTITNSTLFGNRASNEGGGLYSGVSATTIQNSTLSGNSAMVSGGSFMDKGNITVNNSILVNAVSGGNCSLGYGSYMSGMDFIDVPKVFNATGQNIADDFKLRQREHASDECAACHIACRQRRTHANAYAARGKFGCWRDDGLPGHRSARTAA